MMSERSVSKIGSGQTQGNADKRACVFFAGDDEHGWDDEGVFNFVTETVPSAVRAVCTEKYPWLEPPVGMSRGEMMVGFSQGPEFVNRTGIA